MYTEGDEETMYKPDYIHSSDRVPDKGSFEEMVISEADRVRPIIKEQFLREYILDDGDTYDIFNIYCKTFEIDSMHETRMIVLRPDEILSYDEFFFIKNVADKYIGEENLMLSTILGDHLLIVTELLDRARLVECLNKTCKTVKKCYNCNVMLVYSRVMGLVDAPAAYERLKQCMGYAFYADSDKILYEKDIKISGDEINPSPEYELIEKAVRGGDEANLKRLLDNFFDNLRRTAPAPGVAKMYCLELYVCIIRGCSVDKIEKYMKGIHFVQDAKNILDLQEYIEKIGVEITGSNTPEANMVYSSLIRDTVKIIDENLENENLSLRWLAGTILYTNVDYLGKLFKKETGKNFSHYVMEKRMEMAKALILEGKKDRIYEVAEKVGYGSNSQYFSQVFKKYTGVSPLEYKEFARLSREKNR